MLEKFITLLLGLFGIVTVSVQYILPQNSPTQEIPVTVIEDTRVTEIVAPNLKSDTSTPSKPQSSAPAPKIKTKTVEKKSKAQNPSAKPAETVVAESASTSITATTTTEVSPPPLPINFEAINQTVRQAVLNIFCTSQANGISQLLSGSGVLIDSRGIILTNAHIAQYFLIQDYKKKDFMTCVARTGSPATRAYTLKLLYISPQWVKANYKDITNQKPTGTGENDYALLQIASSTNPDVKLESSFPAIAIDGNEEHIQINTPVILVGYPAGFLNGISIERDLYLVSSLVNIGARYTFVSSTLDLFSLGGSPVAQHGASGGAVASGEGKLLGIIVTSTDADQTNNRNLDAISIAHVNRSLSAETNLTLGTLLASDIGVFSSLFDEQVLPPLKKLLLDELDSKNR